MDSLRDFFDRACAAREPVVAAWIIATEGSTYRKAGALMLFTEHERAGLLSGGCLEGDLHEHARALLTTLESRASLHRYDSRGSDDPIWGLGLGCEGMMQVLLLRCDGLSHYQPLQSLLDAQDQRRPFACAIDLASGECVSVIQSLNNEDSVFPDDSTHTHPELWRAACARLARSTDNPQMAGLDYLADRPDPLCFSFKSQPPPSLLICGAGPDVDPVVFFACTLGWQVTAVDHRPAYADPSRFTGRAQLHALQSPDELSASVSLGSFSAALVMSHHLRADGAYLAALAESDIPYIGLLGPAARRERLFAELGPRADALSARLRAPVGLDLGAQTAEEIALAIIAEIQASLRGRIPRSFTTAIAHPYTK
jgi:xanthine dehydrogenase accessory factor